ncbi:MAG: amidase [Chloroflexi bacterium]|nr:MAG: amidase [Chloroflexota bacterium]
MSSTGTIVLTECSAAMLAGMIARRETSSVAVVEAHIERIERVNADLNAVIWKRYAEAREEARLADEAVERGGSLGPLHGVPITIKEAFALSGSPATYGLQSRSTIRATEDDIYVSRLRAAGAIILGKTNVSQLLLYVESDNPVYGRTSNPWNRGRTPGGSSGGQAAIIAAGGSPLGLASDIGGSIRVPATFCGLVGMKATAGRIPDPTAFGVSLGQRAIVSQAGVLARTVTDVELGTLVLCGGDKPDAPASRPLGDPASVDVSKLRVAYYTEDGTLEAAPAVQRAVTEAAGVLAGKGAQVALWHPPAVPEAADLFFGILSADGAQGAGKLLAGNKVDPRLAQLVRLAGLPRPVLGALEAPLRLLGQRSAAALIHNFGYRDTFHYWQLLEAQDAYQGSFAKALDTDEGGPFDLIVCPACALPAFPHGGSKDLVVAGGYAILYNVLGYPAGVVPATRVRPGEESRRKRSWDGMERAARGAEQGSAGLPVGVQIVARPWCEHVAFAAMRAIQDSLSTHPDFPRTPVA